MKMTRRNFLSTSAVAAFACGASLTAHAAGSKMCIRDRGHCAAVDGQRVVRHQRRHVHRPDAACAAALLAGTLRVESQLLRRRRIEMRTALRRCV